MTSNGHRKRKLLTFEVFPKQEKGESHVAPLEGDTWHANVPLYGSDMW